jgi:hypothetical protein
VCTGKKGMLTNRNTWKWISNTLNYF